VRFRLSIALLASALLAALGAPFAAGPAEAQSSAADVAVFYDGTYVDLGTSGGGEAYNIRRTIEDLGHNVTMFTGTDQTSWENGLAGKDLLVLPELQNGDLDAALSTGARAAIANFVRGGGGLIATMDGATAGQRMVAVLNNTFSYSLAFASFGEFTSTLDNTAAAGTPYIGGPATLPWNSAVGAVDAATLPGTAKNIYTSDSGTRAWVTFFSESAGQIALLGWDWYNAQPVGSADGGWIDVLDRSIAQVSVSVGASVDVSDATVTAGGTSSYTVTVTNTGSGTATGVTLADTGIGGLTAVAAAPSQGSCSVAATQIDCSLGSLAAGASATVTVTFGADAAATAQTITHTATVSTGEGASASDSGDIVVSAAPPTTAPPTTTPPTTAAPTTPPPAAASYDGGQVSLSAEAGTTVTVKGQGFGPDTDVQVWLHSEPVLLGTVRTDATGAFSATFPLPAAVATGAHQIVLNGTDVNGAAITRALDLTILPQQLAFTGNGSTQAERVTLAVTAVLVGLALVTIAGARRRPLGVDRVD
jgi:uncharacterized repeat protein (TIGR01451 family)